MKIAAHILGLALALTTASSAFASGEDLRSLYEFSKREAARVSTAPVVVTQEEARRQFEFKLNERAFDTAVRKINDTRPSQIESLHQSYTMARFNGTTKIDFGSCVFTQENTDRTGRQNTPGTCMATVLFGSQICEVTLKTVRLGMERGSLTGYAKQDTANCVTVASRN